MGPIVENLEPGMSSDYLTPPEGEADVEIVKSELRYPIIQAIRSQWESQDLPMLGNQYHVTDDTASQEQGYNTCAPN